MAEVDRQATEPVEVLIERAGFAVARRGPPHARRRLRAAGGGRRRPGQQRRRRAGRRPPPGPLGRGRVGGRGRRRCGRPSRLPRSRPGDRRRLRHRAEPALRPPRPGRGAGAGGGHPVRAVRADRAPVAATAGGARSGRPDGDLRGLQARVCCSATGPNRPGQVEVADIGLGALVGRGRLGVAGRPTPTWPACWPARPRQAHKWQSAVQIVAGSPGMYGAPLAGGPRRHAGRGRLRPGRRARAHRPAAVCRRGSRSTYRLPAEGWDARWRPGWTGCKALVVGPGLGDRSAGGQPAPDRRWPACCGQLAVPGGRGCRRPAGPRRPRAAVAPSSGPGGRRPCSPRTRASTPGWSAGPRGRPDRGCAGRGGPDRGGRAAERAPHRGGRPRRSGPGGQRGSARLATAGTGDVLSGRHRRLSGPRPARRWRPRPWPPTSTAGPPRSGRPRGWWPSRPAGAGVPVAVAGWPAIAVRRRGHAGRRAARPDRASVCGRHGRRSTWAPSATTPRCWPAGRRPGPAVRGGQSRRLRSRRGRGGPGRPGGRADLAGGGAGRGGTGAAGRRHHRPGPAAQPARRRGHGGGGGGVADPDDVHRAGLDGARAAVAGGAQPGVTLFPCT